MGLSLRQNNEKVHGIWQIPHFRGGKKWACCTEGQVFSALTKWIPEFLFKVVQRKAKRYNSTEKYLRTSLFFTSMCCNFTPHISAKNRSTVTNIYHASSFLIFFLNLISSSPNIFNKLEKKKKTNKILVS